MVHRLSQRRKRGSLSARHQLPRSRSITSARRDVVQSGDLATTRSFTTDSAALRLPPRPALLCASLTRCMASSCAAAVKMSGSWARSGTIRTLPPATPAAASSPCLLAWPCILLVGVHLRTYPLHSHSVVRDAKAASSDAPGVCPSLCCWI